MSELSAADELDEQYQKQYLNFLFEKSSLPEFKNLKTFEDYFYYSLNSLIEEKITFERLENGIPKIKNNTDALMYRNSSFDKYKLPETRDLDEILEDCTKSIAYAEQNTNEFIQCYMNRSSALLKSHLYDDCLNDINYIFKNININDSQKVKLLVKKSQCYEILEYPKNDVDYIKNEINMIINKLKKNDKNKLNALEYLNNATNNINKEPFKKILVNENEASILNENNKIIGASDSIKISWSNEYGRHIIATRDIKPGEAILLHKPYASYLVENGIYQFCSYCMKQTWSSVPCNYCVHTVYCTDKCRDLAWSEYHDIECKLIGVSSEWGLGERPMLALKMTILAIREAKSIESLEKKLIKLDKIIDPLEKGMTNGIFDSSKYTSVYSLLTDIDKKRSDQIFHYSNVAVILVYLLGTRTNFLGPKIEKKCNDIYNIKNLTFIGKLLLQNCLIVKTNACSIGDYENELDFDERSIGILPSLAIFNHGCFCKTSRYEFNGKISLQSTCTIEKGEQVYVNYGQTFESSPSCQRKQSIELKYNFNCKCNACDDMWPADLSTLPVMSIPDVIAKKLIDVYKLYHTELRTDDDDDSVIYFDDTIDRMNIKKQLVDVIEELYPHVRHPSPDLITFMEMLTTILGSRSTRWQTLN